MIKKSDITCSKYLKMLLCNYGINKYLYVISNYPSNLIK